MSNLPFPRMPLVVASQGQRSAPDYVGLFFDMRGPALPQRGKVATHLVVDAEDYLDDGLRAMVRVKAYCLRTGEECLFRLRPHHVAHRRL